MRIYDFKFLVYELTLTVVKKRECAKNTPDVSSRSRATGVFRPISYFSPEVTRSRGNLGNKSYQFSPLATQTQLMCV